MWKHKLPRGEEDKHKTTWPEDGKSDCSCGATVDHDTRTVTHKPLRG